MEEAGLRHRRGPHGSRALAKAACVLRRGGLGSATRARASPPIALAVDEETGRVGRNQETELASVWMHIGRDRDIDCKIKDWVRDNDKGLAKSPCGRAARYSVLGQMREGLGSFLF